MKTLLLLLRSSKGMAIIAIISLIIGVIGVQRYTINILESKLEDKSIQLTLARQNERGLMDAIELQNNAIERLSAAKLRADKKTNTAVSKFIQLRKQSRQAIINSRPGVTELNKWLKQFFS